MQLKHLFGNLKSRINFHQHLNTARGHVLANPPMENCFIIYECEAQQQDTDKLYIHFTFSNTFFFFLLQGYFPRIHYFHWLDMRKIHFPNYPQSEVLSYTPISSMLIGLQDFSAIFLNVESKILLQVGISYSF